MHRCSDPLCGRVIDPSQSRVEIAGSLYCSMVCRTSWEMANVALHGAADPFRKSPLAVFYGKSPLSLTPVDSELR
jgi:hypothetical protein